MDWIRVSTRDPPFRESGSDGLRSANPPYALIAVLAYFD